MALPIERWAREAVDREHLGNFFPVADTRVLDDMSAMAYLQLATWKERERQLRDSGVPFAMPEGTYGGLLAYPNAQTITTTSINGSVNLWSNLIYTPIPANSVLAPQAYRVAITAKITTSTSPANLGFNPLINSTGTWTTGGTAISGGTTMGASGNVALTASITNAFYYIVGDITIRTAGTAASTVSMFHLNSTQNTAAGVRRLRRVSRSVGRMRSRARAARCPSRPGCIRRSVSPGAGRVAVRPEQRTAARRRSRFVVSRATRSVRSTSTHRT
jgi:hypothetical protein